MIEDNIICRIVLRNGSRSGSARRLALAIQATIGIFRERLSRVIRDSALSLCIFSLPLFLLLRSVFISHVIRIVGSLPSIFLLFLLLYSFGWFDGFDVLEICRVMPSS